MHEAPERSRAGAVIVAIVITALVVGGGVYFWQQGQVQNLKDDVAAAQQSAQSAQASIKSAQATSAKLQTQVTDLQKQLKKSQKASKTAQQELHQQKKATNQAKQQANALADGKYFAFIKDASSSPDKITYDVAEYFTGKKADKAAIQDGVIKKGQHVENDVYIRNTSKQLRTTDVTSSASVKILGKGGGSPKLKTVSYSDFVKVFNGGGKDNKHLHQNGYWLVASNNKITSITEQFHP
jgi:alanyl-tRNA synthetase